MFSCCSNQPKSTTGELNLNPPVPMGNQVATPSKSRTLSPAERSHYSVGHRLEGSQPSKEDFSVNLKKMFNRTPGRNTSDSKSTESSPLENALSILSKYYEGDPQKYKELITLVRESNILSTKDPEKIYDLSTIRERPQPHSHQSFDKVNDPNSAIRYTNESDLRSHLRNLEPLKDTVGSPPITPKAKEFFENPLMSFGPDEDPGISTTTLAHKSNMFEHKPNFEMREISPFSQTAPISSAHLKQSQTVNPVIQSPSKANSVQGIMPDLLLQSPNNLEKILNLKSSQTSNTSGLPSHELIGSPEWIASLKYTINKINIPAIITPLSNQSPNPERVSVSFISKEVQTEPNNSLNTSQVLEKKEPAYEYIERAKSQEAVCQPEVVEIKEKIKPETFRPQNPEIKVAEYQYYHRGNLDDISGEVRVDTEESGKRTNHSKDRGNSVEFTLEEKEQKADDDANQAPQATPKKPGITETSLTAAQFKIYSNENLLEVEHLISPDIRGLIFQKPDMVILEGELMKYKPGIQHTYVKRWVRVTGKHFQYFKTRWGANCWDDKPLFTVAFSDLRAAYRVNMKLPKNAKIEGNKSPIANKKGLKFAPEIFHLEVFPTNIEVPYDDENILLRNVVKKEDIPTIGDLSQIDNNGSKFYTPTKTSVQVLNVKQDHLMPSPAKEKLEKPSYSSISARKNDKKSPPRDIVTGFRPSIKASAASVEEVFSELNATATKLNNSNERKSRLSVTTLTNIDSRERSPADKNNAAYTWVKSKEDLQSWSGREKEWYYSEKRLLFASQSQKEREIWLSVLTWLICEYNQR